MVIQFVPLEPLTPDERTAMNRMSADKRRRYMHERANRAGAQIVFPLQKYEPDFQLRNDRRQKAILRPFLGFTDAEWNIRARGSLCSQICHGVDVRRNSSTRVFKSTWFFTHSSSSLAVGSDCSHYSFCVVVFQRILKETEDTSVYTTQ